MAECHTVGAVLRHVRILETGAVVNVVTEALVSNPESGELNQELLQVINDNLS